MSKGFVLAPLRLGHTLLVLPLRAGSNLTAVGITPELVLDLYSLIYTLFFLDRNQGTAFNKTQFLLYIPI